MAKNENMKLKARELRNNMTEEELILWSKLKSKQLKNTQFYRQRPIGSYIVDFYCSKYKLVIELDGSQHYEKENMEYDKNRDEYLEAMGLKVLRFSNREERVNLKGVLDKIFFEMK
jgi:very-short-patch-repair endonuclease